MSNISDGSRPKWATREALQARLRILELLGDEGLQAFLETLVVEARKPVPPTLSNWLVLRAWSDGALATAEKFQTFWDKDSILAALKALDEEDRIAAMRRPVGQINPYSEFKDR